MPASREIRDSERLRALVSYRILDTAPEPAFDSIVSLARELFKVPVAGVALVDDRRAWFKAADGLGIPEFAREECPCDLVLDAADVVVIPDTLADVRTRDRGIVTGVTKLRFYAGAPLLTPQGIVIGAFFIGDRKPRRLHARDLKELKGLASLASEQLELRAALVRIAQTEKGLQEVAEALAKETGEAFVASLTRCLTEALGVDYAFVSEADALDPDAVHCTLCESGEVHRHVEYRLAGTPCADVFRGEARCHPEGVQRLFPADEALAELGVEGYAAVPLLDARRGVIGSVGVMTRERLSTAGDVLAHLGVFGTRAATEIARLRVERKLRESERRRAALLKALPDMVFHVDRDGRLLDFHPGQQATPVVPPEQFLGRHLGDVLPPALAREGMAAIERAIDEGVLQVWSYELEEAPGVQSYEARIVASGPDEAVCFVRRT